MPGRKASAKKWLGRIFLILHFSGVLFYGLLVAANFLSPHNSVVLS